MKTEGQGELRACLAYADLLVDLSDGELPANHRQSVEAHVAQCAGCKAELMRLDMSLAALRDAAAFRRAGFQPALRGTRSVPATYYAAAAALSLAILLAVAWGVFRMAGPDRQRESAHVTSPPAKETPFQNSRAAPAAAQTGVLDEAAVLRQIALIEQQARLQASLDLMPKDPWFAQQRAANEELLARFKAATTVTITQSSDASESESGNAAPCVGDTL